MTSYRMVVGRYKGEHMADDHEELSLDQLRRVPHLVIERAKLAVRRGFHP